MNKLLLTLIFTVFLLPYNAIASIDRPNVDTTTGDVLDTNLDVICISGYSKTVRNVSGKLKNKVYNNYNVPKEERGRVTSKIDHLIPLAIGGSNDISNLWPHYFETKSGYGVLKKNLLENKLHKLVCDRDLDIQEAQSCISKDWINCYNKYIK